MTILGYHGFRNWRVLKLEEDDLQKEFTFGIELEVTKDEYHNCRMTPSELSDKISNQFGSLFVCERDSSIGNGVEIISQPMTWNWFIQNQDTFKELLTLCIESGFNSHKGNQCGLHIHIGRQALHGLLFGRTLDEFKVVANMNYILERYQEEVFKFSRRTLRTYNRWSTNYTELYELENGNSFIDKERIQSIGIRDCNRYHVLNLANEKTVEFRFLRGTLKWDTFFISLNFIKNIVEESRFSDNIVSFISLVYKGLDNEWKEKAQLYLSTRRININDERSLKLERTYKPRRFELNLDTLVNELL